MTCLLHDLCALSGLGYAEFWKRDRIDVDLGKSHEPSNDELPYARSTDLGQSSSMPGQDVNARSEITESRHLRTFHKEVSFDDKNKSNSRPAHDDVKARRGISRRGLSNSSRSHMPSICEINACERFSIDRVWSSFLDDDGRRISPHSIRSASVDLWRDLIAVLMIF